ncbi:MAG TPA: hypothetical protein VJV79_32025 [Polyangiaceae bacterium]|nr:hypothetical protein [Polyangiaceae bacterium]
MLLAALAACGGRSSTLDTDGMAADPSQSTSGSPGSANAGKPGVGKPPTSGGGVTGGGASGTGTGGTSGTGTGAVPGTGTGGTSGTGTGAVPGTGTGGAAGAAGAVPAGGSAQGGGTGTPAPTYRSCAEYCSTISQGVCPSGVSVDQCVLSCSAELNGQTARCQDGAINLLTCLTTAYRNSASCGDVEKRSGALCGGLSDYYQSCVGTGTNPIPPPVAAPTCSTSGNSNNGRCTLDVKCDTGAYYSVLCHQTDSGQSSCTCKSGSVNGGSSLAVFNLNEGLTFACYDSLAACGFPQIGPQ